MLTHFLMTVGVGILIVTARVDKNTSSWPETLSWLLILLFSAVGRKIGAHREVSIPQISHAGELHFYSSLGFQNPAVR